MLKTLVDEVVNLCNVYKNYVDLRCKTQTLQLEKTT